MVNWIPTSNPFGLATPPAQFMADLYVQDPDLVIFPSESEAVYRLARKRKHTLGPVAHLRHPDVTTLQRHRLMCITSILPIAAFGSQLLRDIAAMDQWRRLGTDDPDKNIDALERLEDQRQDELTARANDELDMRGSSAYFGMLARQGSVSIGGVNNPRHTSRMRRRA